MITLQELRRIGVSNNIDFGVYNVEHLPGTVDDFIQYLSNRLYELAPVDLIDRYIQDYLNMDDGTHNLFGICDLEYYNNAINFILSKVDQIVWNPTDSLDETDRKGGFGSTSKN